MSKNKIISISPKTKEFLQKEKSKLEQRAGKRITWDKFLIGLFG